MNETIRIDDLTFLVKRSSRRKTVGLTVERDASLVAHLPEEADIDKAGELIRKKLVWVHQKLCAQKNKGREDVFRRPEFVDGEGFYFLGKHYRLKLVDVPSDAPPVATVRFQGDRLLFRRGQVAAGEKRIAEHYTRAAHPYLNDAVNRWKRIVGVKPAQYVQVMDLGFRWASCSSDGKLNFHWRVMQLPPQVIDYLVVHELVHLKVPDHSAAFWKEVGRILPDYERHRRWLKDLPRYR